MQGCLVIGQPHTEECRARTTTAGERSCTREASRRQLDQANGVRQLGGWRLLRQVRAEQTRRNVKTRLGRLKYPQTQEELRAARLQLTWMCDR